MLRATVKWILSPALYAASLPPVLIAYLFVVVGVSGAFGNVLACVIGVSLALGSGTVLVVLNLRFVRLEHSRPPGILDHLRHCTILYAGLVFLAFFLVPELVGPWCCTLQWSFGAVLFLGAGYAVVLNALTLYATRRHPMLRYRS
jgi:hypothetical protein